MKKLLAIVLCIAMLSTLVGCGSTTEPATAPQNDAPVAAPAEVEVESDVTGYAGHYAGKLPNGTEKSDSELVFGWAVHGLQDDWGKVSTETFEARCAEYGIKCKTVSADASAEKQLNDLQNMLAEGIDAIAINPIDTATIADIGEEMYEKGIPFILCTDQSNFPVYAYADGGQVAKAKAAAEVMVEGMDGKGKIVLMTENYSANLMELRRQGLHEVIDATEMEIVDEKFGDSVEDYINLTTDLINSGADFDVIFTMGGIQTNGVLSALEAMGRKDIPVYGLDTDYYVLQLITEGYGRAFVAEFAADTATVCVDTMLALLHGEEVGTTEPGVVVEPRVDSVVTAENAAEMCWEMWHKELVPRD